MIQDVGTLQPPPPARNARPSHQERRSPGYRLRPLFQTVVDAPADVAATRPPQGSRVRPTAPPPLPPLQGLLGPYGPLLYFTGLALIPVTCLALLLSSPSDASFQPLTPDEWTSLVSDRPAWTAPRISARLEVTSEPDGTLVYIDDTLDGITPYQNDEVVSGWHTVTLKKSGFTTADTLLFLDPERTTALSFTLARSDGGPKADASTVPASASGGAERDQTAAPSEPSPAATRTALAEDRAIVTPAPPPTGTTASPSTGTLSVAVHPWGSVYIDGRLYVRDTDLRHTLDVAVGDHVVRAVHPVLGVQEWTVEVQADRQTSVVFDLN